MHAPSKFSSTKKDSDKEKKVKHHEASRSDSLVNETALPGACWNNDFALVKSIIAKDSCNVNFLNERSMIMSLLRLPINSPSRPAIEASLSHSQRKLACIVRPVKATVTL